jgi:hypothetical protein
MRDLVRICSISGCTSGWWRASSSACAAHSLVLPALARPIKKWRRRRHPHVLLPVAVRAGADPVAF